MKSQFLNQLALLLFTLVYFTSCEDLLTELLEEPLTLGLTEVVTNQPQVNSEFVMFEGEVRHIPDETTVEYGFMWFKADEEHPQINKMVVGQRVRDGRFEAPISALPRNERLVVCAYVKTIDVFETETIGEERDFNWGF